MHDAVHGKQPVKANRSGQSLPYLLVILVLCIVLFFFVNDSYLHISEIPSVDNILQTIGVMEKPVYSEADGDIVVHYIDVGQGDCSLIVSNDKNILIDCGEEEMASGVISYLRALNIKKLDYVIATHPHTDHMGGMYRILNSFDIGTVIMPELPDDMMPTSITLERMFDVIENKEINAEYAVAGDIIDVGSGGKLEIIAPVHNDYEDLNNYSVVTKLVHGVNSFLFTGDIERAAENDILNSRKDIRAKVMKVAHHGSTSSSILPFLKRVNPQYAVISVGVDNSYGHPKQEILDRLAEVNSQVITTSVYGNIAFISNGEDISLKVEKNSEELAA